MKGNAAVLCGILLFASACAPGPSEEKRNTDVIIAGMKDRIVEHEKFVDREIRSMREYVKRLATLEEDMNFLRSQIAMLSASARPSKETPAQTQERLVVEKQTEEIAFRYVAGSHSLDNAVKELTPVSKHAVPTLVRTLKKMKDAFQIDESKKVEILLARMPVADLKASIPELTKDAYSRLSAASIIEATGDFELSKSLEPFLAEGDEDFRNYAARILVKCKNRLGIPLLIQALKKNDNNAKLAYFLLEKLARQNFGYTLENSLEQNKEAIQKWEEWWQKTGPAFQFE